MIKKTLATDTVTSTCEFATCSEDLGPAVKHLTLTLNIVVHSEIWINLIGAAAFPIPIEVIEPYLTSSVILYLFHEDILKILLNLVGAHFCSKNFKHFFMVLKMGKNELN